MARWNTSLVVRIVFFSLERGQRGGAQPQAKRLQPDDALSGDVAEVDVGSDPGDKVRLQGGGRSLEEQAFLADPRHQHVLDQPEPQRAVWTADAGPAAFPGLQRDQRRPGFEVLLAELDPHAGRQLL